MLLKLVIPFLLIDASYNLHRDEYLHFDQAKHLDWGYYSVPPISSLIGWLILTLGGNIFWVKFFPALFGALTLLVVWKTIELLGGKLFALSLGAIAIIFSVITRVNILFQPGSLDILCWTLFYFTIAKYIKWEEKIWLLIAGVVFALGFLNKYNIIFLLVGMLPAIIITPDRKIFKEPIFSSAVLLSVLLISPNIIWQFQHKFPFIHHLKILAETQLSDVERVDFLKDQLLFFSGSVFILAAGIYSFFTYAPFYRYRVFFWAFIFTFFLLVLFKAKSYYAIGLYPILLAFGVVYIEKITAKNRNFYWRFFALTIPVMAFIPVIYLAFPTQPPAQAFENFKKFSPTGQLRWEDGKKHPLPQNFADMLGWNEIAAKVDSACKTINDAANTIVLCDNYGQAGAFNYYTTHKNIPAFCMEADYYKWFLQYEKEIKNIILVKTRDKLNDIEKEKIFFKTILAAGKVENIYAGEYGTSIYILKDIISGNLLKQRLIEDNKPW